MAQKENTLTDSLAAAQRRLTVTASTNPIGLSESLTRTQQPNEPVDLNAEIIAEIEALSGALQTFDATSGKPNP
jgi:ethanolamine ammonia-lyase large subunit